MLRTFSVAQFAGIARRRLPALQEFQLRFDKVVEERRRGRILRQRRDAAANRTPELVRLDGDLALAEPASTLRQDHLRRRHV
jgi:hypothetical protein